MSIYSSGSIAAQKLYLEYSIAGNLLSLFDDFFDTTTGPKNSPNSYAAIADRLPVAPSRITFFSDMPPEIIAARQSGLHAIRIDRALENNHFGSDENGLVLGSFVPALQGKVRLGT